jgi:hypothetical protein
VTEPTLRFNLRAALTAGIVLRSLISEGFQARHFGRGL